MTARGDGQGPAGVSAMQALFKTPDPDNDGEPYIAAPTVPAMATWLRKPAVDAAAEIAGTVAAAEATVAGLESDVASTISTATSDLNALRSTMLAAVNGAVAVIETGDELLGYRDDAAASAVEAEAAVVSSPFATLRPAARNVIAVLSGTDGSVIATFVWDRDAAKVRVADHALSSDVDAAVVTATLDQLNGLARPATRGVLAALTGADGRSVAQLIWDRAAQAGVWEGHATTAHVAADIAVATDGLPAAVEQPAPRGVMLRLAADDGAVLIDGRYDRATNALRWAGHALTGDPVSLVDGQVDRPALELDLKRVTVPNSGDAVSVEPVTLRSIAGQPTAKTSITGYGWTRLPADRSPHIIGVNDTGTALQFRRSWGLPIAGQKYIGTFNPGSVASLTDLGTFTSTLPAASGYADGDYLEATVAAGVTIGADTYAQGDLAVKSGGAWVKQACPAGAVDEAEFWQLSAGGTFKGVAYATGDRIIHLTTRTVSGAGRRLWTKGRADQMFLRGETATPSTSPPASPVNGDLWQVTAADGSYAVDDWLLRQGGAWLRLATDGVASYADGATIARRCERGSQDWEFRRSDKSATRVGLGLRSRTESKRARPTSSGLFVIGDSMPGFLASSLTAALAGERTLVTESYGGHTASHLRGIFRDLVLNRGDAYGGNILVTWHGQNNVGDADLTNEVNAEIVALMGSRDVRAILMSVLGQFVTTWNGSRIVVANHEGQFARNATGNVMFRTVLFLEEQFPDFVFDTRKELCIDAPSTPALLWPGLTEAEVAATYGIVPFSYFFNYASVPWTPAALSFAGYRSAAGLPTGGADLDYWIRTVADGGLGHGVGAIYVRYAGVWTVHEIADITHITVPLGNQKLAARIVNRLAERGW